MNVHKNCYFSSWARLSRNCHGLQEHNTNHSVAARPHFRHAALSSALNAPAILLIPDSCLCAKIHKITQTKNNTKTYMAHMPKHARTRTHPHTHTRCKRPNPTRRGDILIHCAMDAYLLHKWKHKKHVNAYTACMWVWVFVCLSKYRVVGSQWSRAAGNATKISTACKRL